MTTATTMKQQATSPANLARINALANDETFSQLIVNLADRWADESEYEDIEDYGKVVQTKLPEGFTLVKMTKRPFGFHFHIGTEAQYAIYFLASGTYGWKRVSDKARL